MKEVLDGFKQFLKTRDTGIAQRIDELLSEHGMSDVLAERYCSDPNMETRDFITWTLLESAPLVIRKSLVGKEGSGWNEARLAKLERDLKEERAAGEAFLRFEMTCYIAKKPE